MRECNSATKIKVIGVVQGVGFRPFVYRLAKKLGLRGYVVNLGGSEVEIHVEGSEERIKEFIERLDLEKPPRARISRVLISKVEPKGYDDFVILESSSLATSRSMVPSDIAICEECIKEILDPSSRFYRYPWNSCAWCGPRFSMIYTIPYDRGNTAMDVFRLCDDCSKDYKDPKNLRRFHAQGVSCPMCGPRTYVYTSDGRRLYVDDVVKFVAKEIAKGAIAAIKGVGGYHIACLASRDDVVAKLRTKKRRPYQPLAIMARDFEVVKTIAIPPPGAKELLESPQRPIVIMPKKGDSKVSELVAPGLSTIGIMLPYTGFHVLLLNEIPDGFLVMTSGNIHGEPMCTNLECVLTKLKDVVDYVVEHERDIVHRVDDSVIRFTDGEPVFLRRSRGYAPEWVEVPIELPNSIALGAELQTAGAIAFENKVILTQYIGDLDDLEALDDLRREVLWFVEVYKLKPKAIAIDMHPLYHNRVVANELSKKFGTQIIEVQHHHAHAVSVLGEHCIPPGSKVMAITIDGTGYGTDGGIWGGEILLTTYENFKRVGSLAPFTLPGGDSAAEYPVKSLIALMASAGFNEDETLSLLSRVGIVNALKYGLEEAAITYTLARKGKGVVTTSIGRVLDAFSALLGVCLRRTYEGEPPMRLEALADRGRRYIDYIDNEIVFQTIDGRTVLDVQNLLRWVIENLDVYRKEDIALTILRGLGRGLAYIVLKNLRGLRNVEQFIVMSGGASVNTYIVQGIKDVLKEEGISVLLPRRVPPGDGGIALGQVLIASQVVNNG